MQRKDSNCSLFQSPMAGPPNRQPIQWGTVCQEKANASFPDPFILCKSVKLSQIFVAF